ncbi:hypothetical protein JA1_003046 [Spathaspora sp. JA1]|nr:hypothetical protein JA1_003046 [Spathaspora sp. JA1]
MDQSKITQLQEMGFSQTQAESALQQTNFDLESAIAYLLGEHIQPPPPTSPQPRPPPTSPLTSQPIQNQLIRYEDTVNISNPEDIPNFSTEFSNSSNNTMQSRNVYDYVNLENSVTDSSSSINPFSIYDHFNTLQRDGFTPPAILPFRLREPKNFLIPILMIIGSNLQKFNQELLSKEFDYAYVENWYRSEVRDVDVPDAFTANKSSYRFFIEVQRVLGYLNHDLSKRLLIGGENLLNKIPNELFTISESSQEFIKKLYGYLIQECELMGVSLGPLFNSIVQDEEGNQVGLSIFQIESEVRGANISETLDNLFWNSEENIGSNTLSYVSPIFTIEMLNYDEQEPVQPMQLEEFFYPGIYSREYVSLITSMSSKRLEIAKERSLISNRIMSLNSFEGKKMKNILQKTIEYLATTGKEPESHDDLSRLSDNLKQETIILNDKLRQLNQEYAQLDVNNHENILQSLCTDPTIQPAPPLPEKYYLIGIILSDAEYLYKTTTYKTPGQDWVYFLATSGENNIVNDFRRELMDFESVNVFFTEATKTGDSFTLVYASESSLMEQGEVEFGEKLAGFFQADNQYLEQEIVRAQAELEPELEISSEEEDEASSMQETPNPEGAIPGFNRVKDVSEMIIDL